MSDERRTAVRMVMAAAAIWLCVGWIVTTCLDNGIDTVPEQMAWVGLAAVAAFFVVGVCEADGEAQGGAV